MSKPCSICINSKLTRVDQCLLRGETLAEISRKFGFSADCLGRHRKHMKLALKGAIERKVEYGDSLLAQLQAVRAEIEQLGTEALNRRDVSGALRCLRERLRTLELEGKLSGQLESGGKVNVAVQVSNNRGPVDAAAYAEMFLQACHVPPELIAAVMPFITSKPPALEDVCSPNC